MYSDKIGLIIWGSKGQYAIFCHNSVVQPQDPCIKNTVKDIRQILSIQWPGKDFWALEFCETNGVRYKTYTLYRSSYDGARRGSFIAITMYVPVDIEVEDSCTLLKEMMDMYFSEYIDPVYNIPLAGKYDDIQPYNKKLDEHENNQKIKECPNHHGMIVSKQNDIPDVYLYEDESQVQKFYDNPFDRRFFECQEVMFINKNLYDSGVTRFSITPTLITDEDLRGAIPSTQLNIFLPKDCEISKLKIGGKDAFSVFVPETNTATSVATIREDMNISFEIKKKFYEIKEFSIPARSISRNRKDGTLTYEYKVKETDLQAEVKELSIQVKDENGSLLNDAKVFLEKDSRKIQVSNGKCRFSGSEIGNDYTLYIEWVRDSYIKCGSIKPSDIQSEYPINVKKITYKANRSGVAKCTLNNFDKKEEGKIRFDEDGKMVSSIVIPQYLDLKPQLSDSEEYSISEVSSNELTITPKQHTIDVAIDEAVCNYLTRNNIKPELEIGSDKVNYACEIKPYKHCISITIDCDQKDKVREIKIGDYTHIINFDLNRYYITCVLLTAESAIEYTLPNAQNKIQIKAGDTHILPTGKDVYVGNNRQETKKVNELLEKITLTPASSSITKTLNEDSSTTIHEGSTPSSGNRRRQRPTTDTTQTTIYNPPKETSVPWWRQIKRNLKIATPILCIVCVAIAIICYMFCNKPQPTITFIFEPEFESTIQRIEPFDRSQIGIVSQCDTACTYTKDDEFREKYTTLKLKVLFQNEGELNYELQKKRDDINKTLGSEGDDTIYIKVTSPAMEEFSKIDLKKEPGSFEVFTDNHKDFEYTDTRWDSLWSKLVQAYGKLNEFNYIYFHKVDSIVKFKDLYHLKIDSCKIAIDGIIQTQILNKFDNKIKTILNSLDVTFKQVESLEKELQTLNLDRAKQNTYNAQLQAYKTFITAQTKEDMKEFYNKRTYKKFSNNQQEIFTQIFAKPSKYMKVKERHYFQTNHQNSFKEGLLYAIDSKTASERLQNIYKSIDKKNKQ